MRVRITCLAPVLLLLAGCGMDAVDTRIQARSAAGIDLYPLVVAEQQWVCPNVVSLGNQPFDPKSVAAGEVEDQFGPFVPCATVVPAGEGTCPNCNKAYRTSGPAPDYTQDGEEDLPSLALPKFECPHCHELVSPTAVLTKGSKEARRGDSVCPSCHGYFTLVADDQQLAVDIHGESFCPACKQAFDPTMNACTNKTCKLGGVVRNAHGYTGPCWRCGGTSICPNCSGSGQGSLNVYGTTPAECWYCGDGQEGGVGSGRCPDCDDTGFARYEGVLPDDYAAWKKAPRRGEAPTPNPPGERKWCFKRAGEPAGEASE